MNKKMVRRPVTPQFWRQGVAVPGVTNVHDWKGIIEFANDQSDLNHDLSHLEQIAHRNHDEQAGDGST